MIPSTIIFKKWTLFSGDVHFKLKPPSCANAIDQAGIDDNEEDRLRQIKKL